MSKNRQEFEVFDSLDVSVAKPGQIYKCFIRVVEDGAGRDVSLPILIAKGVRPGPVLGFTAAIHGNELNGIRVIHKLFQEIEDDLGELAGTIVGVPVLNLPGFLGMERAYSDGTDLNRVMPGNPSGNTSEVYAYRIVDRIIRHFDYLIDLHTASFGRVNSFYVRADMEDDIVRKLALLQCPQIIVHNRGKDGTLRAAAADLGIPSITVEVGDPQRFQKRLIKYSLVGIQNILGYLNLITVDLQEPDEDPFVCASSYWIYCEAGGLLHVLPDVGKRVIKGEVIANVTSAFGDVVATYRAPEDGIVVGKSSNPVATTGARILHLGIEAPPNRFTKSS